MNRQSILDAAHRISERDHRIEIEEDEPTIADADGGYRVQAWVYVTDEQVKEAEQLKGGDARRN